MEGGLAIFTYHVDKKKKIYEILSIVKFGSVLFSGIIVIKAILGDEYFVSNPQNYFLFTLEIIGIMAVSIFYYVWAFVIIKRRQTKETIFAEIIESIFFMSVFTLIILLTGANNSQYKFIFLFIIISSTIQCGMKFGSVISWIASIFLLGIDLIFSAGASINEQFENDLIVSAIFIFTAWVLGYYVKIEKEHISKLEELVNIDSLTGLFNHRHFYEELKKKINLAKQDLTELAILFLDIDYFKKYNDLHGHHSGDNVLRQMGEIFLTLSDPDTVIARYGGDEFVVILTGKSDTEAFALGEKIRKTVENTRFPGEEDLPSRKLTISVGVALFSNEMKDDVELMNCADDALYRAKFYNKNRVEQYTSVLSTLKEDVEKEHFSMIASLETLISVINAKDRYTYGHIERVVIYAKMIADKLNLSNEDKKNLIYGAYMHDIGKINISGEILNKKMALTEQEWNIIKEHPATGVEIIKPVPSLKALQPIVLHHHERYDGFGYPAGLAGEDIPYLARILTVVDCFDAMTSDRPYRKRLTFKAAIEECKRNSGTQLDPEILESFIELIEDNNFTQDGVYSPKTSVYVQGTVG